MTDIGMTIMIDDRSAMQFDEVARVIESRGVHIQEKLPHIGAIIGVGDPAAVAAVSSIDGVQSVRPEKTFSLPPMSETIPQ